MPDCIMLPHFDHGLRGIVATCHGYVCEVCRLLGEETMLDMYGDRGLIRREAQEREEEARIEQDIGKARFEVDKCEGKMVIHADATLL